MAPAGVNRRAPNRTQHSAVKCDARESAPRATTRGGSVSVPCGEPSPDTPPTLPALPYDVRPLAESLPAGKTVLSWGMLVPGGVAVLGTFSTGVCL